MISIKSYALVSQDTYLEKESFPKITKAALTLQKSINGIWGIIDINPEVVSGNNFYAALYLKFQNGKATDAVIAFRGTVTSKPDNVIEDIYSWYSSAMGTDWHDHLPGYYTNAVNFTFKVFEYLRAHFPHLFHPGKIRFTGHSLGAALAQLVSLMYYNAPCIIFNSPVCRNITTKSGLLNWKLVHNINAHYGFINKVGGAPVGKVNVVDIPQMEEEAKSMFQHFSESTFESGKLLNQTAEQSSMSPSSPFEAVAGTAEHAAALLGSGAGLRHLHKEHMEILECEKPYQGDYMGLIGLEEKALGEASCNMKVLMSTMANTIMAQHDIGHMVTALSAGSAKLGGMVV